MPKKVRIPTVGVVEFPDDFTNEQILKEVDAYRERHEAAAEAEGKASDWELLEHINKEYKQDFYLMKDAQSFLKGETAKHKKSASRWGTVTSALEVAQYVPWAFDISRHTEVAGGWAGAVTRDILTNLRYSESGTMIPGRWDNLQEYYKSLDKEWEAEGAPPPGFMARGAMALTGDDEGIIRYQQTRPQYPADAPGELHPFQQGLASGAEMMPTIMLGAIYQRAGVPAPIAYGGVMGWDTYAKTGDPVEAAKAAALAAIIPSVGAGGRHMAGKMLANMGERAPFLANAATAHKVIESTVSLGTIGVFMEGMSLPEYMAATPEERIAMLQHSIGALIAFGPMEAAAVAGKPSHTQTLMGQRMADPGYKFAQSVKGYEALMKSPEGMKAIRQMADDYAVDALNPQNAQLRITESGKRPAILDAVETRETMKQKETFVPMTEQQAVELKDIGVDPFAEFDPHITMPEIVRRLDQLGKEQKNHEPDSIEGIAIKGAIESLREKADKLLPAEPKEAPEVVEGKEPAADAPLASLPPGEPTMPRRIKAPDISGKEPVSIAEIRQYLSEALDIPIRVKSGAQYSSQALGVFYPKAETIRTNMRNDLPTIAHEVGHYLHYILFPGAKDTPMLPKADAFQKRFDNELLKLGKATSKESYTKHQVRKEGVAEFFRHYLTDRAQALSKAPDFLYHFEQALQHQHPEIWKIVTKASEDTQRYLNQPSEARVESMIVRSEDTPSRTGFGFLKYFSKRAWVDELAPIELAMEQLKHLPAEQDAYKLALNYTGGWRGKVEYSFEVAQIDFNGKEVGPSLKEILGPVDSHKNFDTYLAARRVLELNKRGKRTGIDRKDAEAVVKQYDKQYSASAKKLYKFLNNELKMLEQAGIIDAKGRKAMEQANQEYVPFSRVMESRGFEIRHGKGFVDVSKPTKKFTGGDEQIHSPLETVIKNVYLFRDVVERNRVASAFVDAVEGTRGGGRVAERVGLKMRPTKVSGEEVNRFLNDMGLKELVKMEAPDIAAALKGNEITFEIWRSYSAQNVADQVIGVWKNGKQKFYQIEDADLYHALTMRDSSQAALLGNAPSFLTLPTRLVRAGATLTPEFMARNPFRDQIVAGVYSEYGYIPFVDGFRGMLSVLKKDKLYWEWVKSGGRYADFIAADRKDITRKLSDFKDDPSVGDQIKKWGNPLTTLQKMSETMEVITRVSEFRRAKARGASDLEAANASKDVTLNFSRHGYYGKFYNQATVFFNAKVQDLSKFARQQQKHPVRTNLKALMYITTPSLIAWWLGKDDEAIQDLPEWRKNLFWNVNLKPMADKLGMETDDDFIFSFPKPFMLGTLYGTSVEKALDMAYKDDPNAIAKFYEDLESHSPLPVDPIRMAPESWRNKANFNLSPGDKMGINWENLPTALKPLVETVTNLDLFRHQPIESEAMKKLPKHLRYKPQTSEIAKVLGGATEWSPLKIDNFIQKTLAGMGKYGTDALDWAIIKSRLIDIPEPPAKSAFEYPVLRAFKKSPYSASRKVNEFYRGMDRAEKVNSELRHMVLHMEDKKQQEFLNRGNNRERLLWYGGVFEGRDNLQWLRLGRVKLSTINKAMQLTLSDREFSADEKRSRLLFLSKRRDDLAAALVTRLHPDDYRRVK